MPLADYFHIDILVQICSKYTFSKEVGNLDFCEFFPRLHFVHETCSRSSTTGPGLKMV